MKAICNIVVHVDSQAPKTSSQAEKVLQVSEMHKEAHQAADGPTSLGATSKERSHPQLSSGCDASIDSTTEADPRLSAPKDSIPLQQDQTKSTRDGLETAHTDSGINEESRANEISKKIKMEDLSDLLKDTISAFFTPDSPQDEPIIVLDESEVYCCVIGCYYDKWIGDITTVILFSAAHWKLVVSDDNDEFVCFILFVGCNFIGSPMIMLFIGTQCLGRRILLLVTELQQNSDRICVTKRYERKENIRTMTLKITCSCLQWCDDDLSKSSKGDSTSSSNSLYSVFFISDHYIEPIEFEIQEMTQRSSLSGLSRTDKTKLGNQDNDVSHHEPAFDEVLKKVPLDQRLFEEGEAVDSTGAGSSNNRKWRRQTAKLGREELASNTDLCNQLDFQVNEARGAKDTLGYSFRESCIKDLESLHLGIFVMI
ncbi:hypothetical protein Tco_0287733 [Tanacetum coccineum]